jgi:hypothetical protein
VKKATASIRASHLNTGTGIPNEELAWLEMSGCVTRLHLEDDERSTVTSFGDTPFRFRQQLRRPPSAIITDDRRLLRPIDRQITFGYQPGMMEDGWRKGLLELMLAEFVSA